MYYLDNNDNKKFHAYSIWMQIFSNLISLNLCLWN